MEYNRCPRCDLNYKLIDEQYCSVCQKELRGEYSIEESDMICPICFKNVIVYDDIMCASCQRKRKYQGKQKL